MQSRMKTHPVQTQGLKAFQDMNDTLNRLKEDLFRVVELEQGYKFFGYLDLALVSEGEVVVSTSFVGIDYAEVDVDINTFPNTQVLIKYLKLKADYVAWVQDYLKDYPEHDTEFKRDLEAEKEFNNFIESQQNTVDANNFKL